MAYRVRIENFEGPFDLLLDLVSRQRVDIGVISITDIIDQYLAEIQNIESFDLDVASDFMLVAATLLKIKTESLLPSEEVEVDEDIAQLAPSEARDILVNRLITYMQYKNAANDLRGRLEHESRVHVRTAGPGTDFIGLMPDYLSGVEVNDIAGLAAAAFSRKEMFLLDSEHIAAKPLPVEVFVRTVFERVRNKKKLNFSELIDDRMETKRIVVTFLAILELYKRNYVKLAQRKEFGDISITYIEGSGDLVLDENDPLTSVSEE